MNIPIVQCTQYKCRFPLFCVWFLRHPSIRVLFSIYFLWSFFLISTEMKLVRIPNSSHPPPYVYPFVLHVKSTALRDDTFLTHKLPNNVNVIFDIVPPFNGVLSVTINCSNHPNVFVCIVNVFRGFFYIICITKCTRETQSHCHKIFYDWSFHKLNHSN